MKSAKNHDAYIATLNQLPMKRTAFGTGGSAQPVPT